MHNQEKLAEKKKRKKKTGSISIRIKSFVVFNIYWSSPSFQLSDSFEDNNHISGTSTCT